MSCAATHSAQCCEVGSSDGARGSPPVPLRRAQRPKPAHYRRRRRRAGPKGGAAPAKYTMGCTKAEERASAEAGFEEAKSDPVKRATILRIVVAARNSDCDGDGIWSLDSELCHRLTSSIVGRVVGEDIVAMYAELFEAQREAEGSALGFREWLIAKQSEQVLIKAAYYSLAAARFRRVLYRMQRLTCTRALFLCARAEREAEAELAAHRAECEVTGAPINAERYRDMLALACDYCGAAEKDTHALRACSRCRSSFYCDTKCE